MGQCLSNYGVGRRKYTQQTRNAERLNFFLYITKSEHERQRWTVRWVGRSVRDALNVAGSRLAWTIRTANKICWTLLSVVRSFVRVLCALLEQTFPYHYYLRDSKHTHIWSLFLAILSSYSLLVGGFRGPSKINTHTHVFKLIRVNLVQEERD